MQNRNRALPLVAFFGACAYLPLVTASGSILRWGLLAVAVPLLLIGRPFKLTLFHLLTLALLVASTLSLLAPSVATIPDEIGALYLFALFVGCVWVGSLAGEEEMHRSLLAVAIGVLVSLPVGLAQWGFHYHAMWLSTATTEPSGLFVNARLWGEALGLIGALALVEWPAIVVLVTIGLFITGDRNGSLALLLAAGLSVMLARRRTVIEWLTTGWAALVALTVLIGRSFESGLNLSGVSSGRSDIWRDVLDGFNWTGHGFGSLYAVFPMFSTHWKIMLHGRPEFAHNEFLSFLFETGPLGCLLFVAVLCYALFARRTSNEQQRALDRSVQLQCRLVAVAFVSECIFGFPAHMPTTALIGGLCLGYLARGSIPVRAILRAFLDWGRSLGFSASVCYPAPGAMGFRAASGSRAFGALRSLALENGVVRPPRGEAWDDTTGGSLEGASGSPPA